MLNLAAQGRYGLVALEGVRRKFWGLVCWFSFGRGGEKLGWNSGAWGLVRGLAALEGVRRELGGWSVV